jgi:TPR repeat protein
MKPLFLLVVALAMVFVACAEHSVTPNAAYYFKSKAQLRETEREAFAGDNAAAKRMADYYYFAKNDRADCIWWYKLAALRGDPVAKENLKKLQQELQ